MLLRSLAKSALALVLLFPFSADAQSFEDAVVDVGNIGLTITNAGFVGRANVRNNVVRRKGVGTLKGVQILVGCDGNVVWGNDLLGI